MSTYRGKYPNKIKSVTTFNGSNGSVFCSCLTNNGEIYTFSADSLGYDLPNPGDDIQKFIDMSVSNSQKLEDEKDVTIHESNEDDYFSKRNMEDALQVTKLDKHSSNKVKQFLQDEYIKSRLIQDGEDPFIWFIERYHFYKENWRAFGIRAPFNLENLFYNLRCDFE